MKYESGLPENRRRSGWREATFQGVVLEPIQSAECPEDTPAHVHVFTGFNTHPKIWAAFHRLPLNAECRRFAFAEAPEARGPLGLLRRLKYRWVAHCIRDRLDGMLALGQLGVDFYRTVLPQSFPVYEFAYYDVSDSDIQVLNPSDSESRQPAGSNDQSTTSNQKPTTPYRFLYVGQLIHRKGVDRLLRALSELRDDNWQLDIVGAGVQKKPLQRLAQRLGIEHQVSWHGAVRSEALSSYYSTADCLVLPSRWDGWGMTVNEALRYGCDILASDACGAASAVPLSGQLPKRAKRWTQFLEAKMRAGVLTPDARAANQQLAKSLSGETGAERLKDILEG